MCSAHRIHDRLCPIEILPLPFNRPSCGRRRINISKVADLVCVLQEFRELKKRLNRGSRGRGSGHWALANAPKL
jgi:hypothetical protein